MGAWTSQVYRQVSVILYLAENAQELIFVHIPKRNTGDNPHRKKKLAVPLFFQVLRLCNRHVIINIKSNNYVAQIMKSVLIFIYIYNLFNLSIANKTVGPRCVWFVQVLLFIPYLFIFYRVYLQIIYHLLNNSFFTGTKVIHSWYA